MEIEKIWDFELDFDKRTLVVKKEGVIDSTHLFKQLYKINSLHLWLCETINTFLLSQDSNYYVILDGQVDKLEGWQDFVTTGEYLLEQFYKERM